MNRFVYYIIFIFFAFNTFGQNIYTFAGTGNPGYSGDGGQATSASIGFITDVAVDASGNIFLSDNNYHCIRKINSVGIISTYAGTGVSGYSGDGGLANLAKLNDPYAIAVDGSGNLYIADSGNNRIRKVATSGSITTIAGTGTAGFSGDGGQASLCLLSRPCGIAVDASNNIYIVDGGNNRVRMIDPTGTITTIAGTGVAGFSGDGGPATSAQFNFGNSSLAFGGIEESGGGVLFITDSNNGMIRIMLGDGNINSIAGNPTSTLGCGATGVPALSVPLVNPIGVTVDASGNIYVPTQFGCSFLKKRDISSGIISNVAGNTGNSGTSGDGGLATQADLYDPWASAIDASGNIYIVGNGYKARVVCNSNCLAGIKQLSDISDKISIYPNPTSDKLMISELNQRLENCIIEISNTLGQSVLAVPFTNSIDVSQLPNGCYFLGISDKGGHRLHAKFIKE